MVVIGDKNIKEFIGKVVSNKMQKTVVVSVETVKKHPLYKKRYVRDKRYYAHDEENICNIGDIVKIRETRPLSKKKRRNLMEVVQKQAV